MKNLAAALGRVQANAKYLQKKGKNEQQGYTFAREADYLAYLKPLLDEAGVSVIVSYRDHTFGQFSPTSRGTAQWYASVICDVTFIHTESGESIVISAPGFGVDTGDKAIYKAMTGGLKYALAKTCMIPTGDDPEEPSEGDSFVFNPSDYGFREIVAKYNGTCAHCGDGYQAATVVMYRSKPTKIAVHPDCVENYVKGDKNGSVN